MTPLWLQLVLVTLAGARLARLTTDDAVLKVPRRWLHQRVLFSPEQRRAKAADRPLPPPRSQRVARLRAEIYGGLRCRWCVGVWWCAILAATAAVWGQDPAWAYTTGALAAAYALGWLADQEADESDDDEPES